ncbi:excalibur calcium-binding domain-containing protein [Actinomadura pelletieri DSM 43383]|uniref:Excalibur calcium-binding domain-containing protein n=1 Tax=Actinomadura pelletieri DSM 43383 TaxID=1120940 RepID=A0A495QBX2_9ACTN|nr:excalibur calcium-binding domain-containing protein [Actinomadura pelletieri]RKS69087.1 excalibur calcium-binding domain-containing protein [Actinomadura pelletieri DSM 43383]
MPEPPRSLADRVAHRWFRVVLAVLAAAVLLGALLSCGTGSDEPEQAGRPGTTVPPTSAPPTPPPPPRTPPPPQPGEESPDPRPGDGLDPRFATCAQANAHGYGPYVRGVDPEYYWYLDRDRDGIDCEPWTYWPSPSEPPSEEPSPLPSEPPSSPPDEVPDPSSPDEAPSDGDTGTEPPSPPSEEPPEPGEPPSDTEPGGEPSEPAPGEQP